MNTLRVSRIGPSLVGGDAEPLAWLGPEERARLASFGPGRQRMFLAARALLRRELETATGIEPARWDVSARPGCAPVARLREQGDGARAPAVSLSHRLGWVAAATADAALGAIGVDVECRRPSRTAVSERAALMLSCDQLTAWQRLRDEDREPALLRAWVAKEAWYKAMPAGAAPWDFRRLACDPCERAQANVRVWQAGELFVALCCHDARALGETRCDGLPDGDVAESRWHVRVSA
jgi:phosphopantetheinyl transferase